MFINSRAKPHSQSMINISDLLNTSVDESRVDSNFSKHFTRKQLTENDSNRNTKTSRPTDQKPQSNLTQRKTPNQHKKQSSFGNGFIRQDDLLWKISHTHDNNSLYTPSISTDRATQSVLINKSRQTQNKVEDVPTTKKRNNNDLEEELELKLAEIILLQDQNMNLKQMMASKESQYQQLTAAKQKQYQQTIEKLNEQINTLTTQLKDKNEQIKNLKKTQTIQTRELKGLKYDKIMLEKQLQQIYKKRLPKELKDLMSFRELSLMRQVEQLREELQKQKTQKQKKMEVEIGVLKQNNTEKDNNLKKLQIQSHMLSKKIIDTEEQLKFQTQHFSRCFSSLKETNTDLMGQLTKVKKQNLKLKRIHILCTTQKEDI